MISSYSGGQDLNVMKQASENNSVLGYGMGIAVDTSFVLFFLAVEYGRAVHVLSLEGGVMGITLAMVLVLSYFLPSRAEKPPFANWIAGRCLIAVSGAVVGIVIRQNMGTVLPESLRSIPLTLLILATMISCYIQFYSLLKLRLAK